MKTAIHLLFALVVVGACKPSQATTSANPGKNPTGAQTDYRQVAQARLGKNIVYVANADQTLVLCRKVEAATAPAMVNAVHFLVINPQTNTIFHEDRIVNGNVEWHNATQLKISTIPGTVQVPGKPDNFYLYDVKTGQKLPPASEKL